MLAGEPPFRGETALSVAVQHLQASAAALENVRPDLPPALCRIVHKMLAKEPDDRYATPRQLLHELRAVSIELFHDDPGEEFEGWADDDLPAPSRPGDRPRNNCLWRCERHPCPRCRRGSLIGWLLRFRLASQLVRARLGGCESRR